MGFQQTVPVQERLVFIGKPVFLQSQGIAFVVHADEKRAGIAVQEGGDGFEAGVLDLFIRFVGVQIIRY